MSYKDRCKDTGESEEDIFRRKEIGHFYSVLSQLPDPHQQILQHTLKGKTNGQIARRLETDLETIKALKKEVYLHLHKKLESAFSLFMAGWFFPEFSGDHPEGGTY